MDLLPRVLSFELLRCGSLIRRYKRFLADVDINGTITTVHCPNTGSLLTVLDQLTADSPSTVDCFLSVSKNKNRKYENTLEMVSVNGTWVGIHSALANKIVLNALNLGLISECKGYTSLSSEVSHKDSKIDFELLFEEENDLESNSDRKKKRKRISAENISHQMFLEVKSVTMRRSNSTVAEFPDCVSLRATKHAKFLTNHVRSGGKGAILFLIQRSDVSSFTISSIDPEYQQAVHEASLSGVLILPYVCHLSPENSEIKFGSKVPFIDPLDDAEREQRS
jgi:sugar fermentation stimulation protein A